MTPTLMVLAALATYRLTLLVTDDAITEDAREWARTRISGHGLTVVDHGAAAICECGDRWGGRDQLPMAEHHVRMMRGRTGGWRGKALTLIGCPWCVSIWLGAPVVALGYLADGALWWEGPALFLAVSAVTGLLHRAAHP